MKRTHSGFTLAELVVATTLMSIAMIGVYTTFHSTVLHWRSASASEKTYTDARRIFAILQHDLNGIPNDRMQLNATMFFNGSPYEFSFLSTIRPMNVEDQAVERLYAVRYYFDRDSLIREERPVEGPLPNPYSGLGTERSQVSLRLGEPYERVVADGILDSRITYLWTPGSKIRSDLPPMWTPLIERPTATNRLPAGLRIEFLLNDPSKEGKAQDTSFSKTFKFDGFVSYLPDDLEQDGGDA